MEVVKENDPKKANANASNNNNNNTGDEPEKPTYKVGSLPCLCYAGLLPKNRKKNTYNALLIGGLHWDMNYLLSPPERIVKSDTPSLASNNLPRVMAIEVKVNENYNENDPLTGNLV